MASVATKYWDGGGAINNWSEAANWDFDTLPTATDDIVFVNTSDTICVLYTTTENQFASLTLDSNYTATLFLRQDSINGTDIFKTSGDITINGGKIVVIGDTTAINSDAGGSVGNPYGEGMTLEAANILVGFGGSINADGRGFDHDSGPGKPVAGIN